MGIRNTIGDNVRAYRTKRKMTQEQLSEKSGVSRTSLGAIERGIQFPRGDTLQKLADALDIAIMQLLAEFDESGNLIIGHSTEKMRTHAYVEQKTPTKRGRKKKQPVETVPDDNSEINYGIIAWGNNMLFSVDVSEEESDYASQIFANLRKQGCTGEDAIEKFEQIWPKIREIYELD